MIALIDGDTVAYRCAAATERVWYEVDGEWYRYKREAIQAAEIASLPESAISSSTITEDLGNTLHTVDLMLRSVMEETDATDMEVYLTGKGNYRYELATTQEYKGNRTKAPPSNLASVREYLQETFPTFVVDGCEADDALGVRQMQEEESCICTTDKDLDMIPGWHYNLHRKELYNVSEWDAIYFFYKQLLTGDSVDNIPGLRGVGPVGADKILAGATTEEELYARVQEKYEFVVGPKYIDYLEEQASLLWIQREEGQLWVPPDA